MTPVTRPTDARSLTDQFGKAVKARLDVGAQTLDPAIAGRLAASRRVALAQRPARRTQVVRRLSLAGMFGSDSDGTGFNAGLALAASALLLAGLLFAVDLAGPDDGDQDSLEVDAEILTDDLPFTAHLDPVFPEILRREE
ncbi:hypothetical protein BH10PSE17_BH10PSE17_06640 [soil metagenome]